MKQAFDESLLEENVDDLYENAPCGYLSALPDGTIVKVNKTLLSMLGYKSSELLNGTKFQELLSVGGKIYYETHFGPLLQMQGFVNEINVDLVCKDARRIPVLTSVVQRRDQNGRSLINRVTVFDITDRKKYERELLLERQKAERAARAKADFLSMMSHEIRTPMNAVIGVAHLLETTELSEVQSEYMELLKTSSENLMNLLNGILDFSKIESGHVALEQRTFDVVKVVRDCATSLQARAQQKGVALKLDVDRKIPPFVTGDPVKIGQIVNNLVSNAIKFTEQGEVTIMCRILSSDAKAATIQFTVQDTGIGIAEEKLASIFDEFSQADYEIGMRFGGSGLGLAITKKLLEMHGSKISVASELGKGSKFSFELTLQLAEPIKIDESKFVKPNSAQLAGVKVLVAEDNEDNIFLLERLLTSWGVVYECVQNGREAVEKLRARNFDIVLMDLRMPVMDGYKATNAIRTLPGKSKAELPIIAFSASTKVGEEDLIEITPFNDTIGKPFRPEELFSKLAFFAQRSANL